MSVRFRSIVPPTFLRKTQAGQYSAPQTVLGFYALFMVIVEAGLVGVLIVLAASDSLHYLIPWALAFAGAVLIALLGVVVTMNVRSPTKLQLGEVKGKDFLEHQQVIRGDSIAGEYLGPAPTPSPAMTASRGPAIEAKLDAERDEGDSR